MTRVVGMDVSANRIAFAICDSVGFYASTIVRRNDRELVSFVAGAASLIRNAMDSVDCLTGCLEINLHPKLTHNGHLSPKMVKAYMRSRWVEGALLALAGFDEPFEATRKPGRIELELGWTSYAIEASWSPAAKAKRRSRMESIYVAHKIEGMTEDEIDALAIAHDCAVALNLAERGLSL